MAEAPDRVRVRRGGPPKDEDEISRYIREGPRYASGLDDDDTAVISKSSSVQFPWQVALLGIAIVAVVGWLIMRFGASPGESIHRIRHYPAEFKDRAVVLRGRVADVFDLGGSYAFNLQQGRDTIVVFTRGKRPLEQSHVEVHGSVSVGYLDGAARPSVFESERR
jgi:hypothetical protein